MVKISSLVDAGTITGTEQIPVNDWWTTKRTTVDDILLVQHNHTASDVTDFNASVDARIDVLTDTAKTTPVDTDVFALWDTVRKKVTWANIKTTLKTYFDSVTTTFTNKRITERVTIETSSATPTINTDNTDIHRITALALAITSMTTNLTWTPTHWQKLIIEITGTATRTITRWASFEASTIALPLGTSWTDMLSVWFIRNSDTSKWRCVASA